VLLGLAKVMKIHTPRVFLVGAGPGDPGLMTLRAAELLAQADLVLYDQLVPRRLLDFANPAAEFICVRDLPGTHPDKYPHIYNKLIEAAREGKTVVRFKGGDPLIFGRGGEEAETLRAAGIDYEIVPGVTAALAAASYLDVPLTHRLFASAIAFVTGHELPQKPGNKLDWESIAKFPGTLAIYMGIARLPLIISELLKYGKPADTPAAIVERASTGDMRSVFTTLGELEPVRRSAGLEAPGLILVGASVGLKQGLSWYEQKPLFGQRVMVTRPRHQAGPMLRKLEQLGAVTFLLPTIEVREPSDFGPLDEAIGQLPNQWDWIVFASSNAVQQFFKRLKNLGRDLRALGGVKLAAVGPKTAEALRELHLNPDIVPGTGFSAESLAELMEPVVRGQRVLLPRANRGKDTLIQKLSEIATVHAVTAYEQVDTIDPEATALDSLRRGEIGFVTLTSSNIARNLLSIFDETIQGRIHRGEIRLIAISSETAKVVQEQGYPVAGLADAATMESLVDTIIRLAHTPAGNAIP
jgi:uroporphyrinogen III methyltransferase / synthase